MFRLHAIEKATTKLSIQRISTSKLTSSEFAEDHILIPHVGIANIICS
jgi:hypothetical protein